MSIERRDRPVLTRRAIVAGLSASALVVPPAKAADWQKDWDQLLEAARKEGRVVVSGPIGNSWQDVLASFQADTGIKVEYTGNWGRDFFPRLIQERKVGKYLWDLRTTAAGIESYELLPEGKTFVSLRDLLFRPDVVGDENWYGGYDSLYGDKAKKWFLGFGLNSQPTAWVNRDIIPESQLANLKELLKPEFKGKISVQDLRAGAAVVTFGVIVSQKDFGPDFIRQLVKQQEAPIVKNSRQQVEWMVRGRYPVAVVPAANLLFSFQQEGLGKNCLPLQEGILSYASGFGGLMAFADPPNPNAQKLYANWLLTKPVQERIGKLVGSNSRRTDVQVFDPSTAVNTARLSEYVDSQREEMLPYYGVVAQLARELE
jgi:ABC-type Fe3+ transport system substrate-binding protein